MPAPQRPVTGLDHGLSKSTVIHAGLVFAGHLDADRLRQAAEKLMDAYPELQVVVKRKLPSLGKFVTPPATKSAMDFKSREWPNESLADLFPPSFLAQDERTPVDKIMDLGKVNGELLNGLFSFDVPSMRMVGLAAIPAVMFRVTTIGSEDGGHTALGLIVPHVLLDGQGVAALVEAWGRLYRGETLPERTGDPHPDVAKLLGAGDESQPAHQDERPECQLRSSQIDNVKFGVDSCRKSAKGVEEHYFHVPDGVLIKVRDEARASAEASDAALRVSKMDVFCAIVVKLCAGSSLVREKQPVNFYHAYTFTPVFPKGSLPSPYLHNFHTFGLFSFPSPSTVLADPPAAIAVAVRKRLNALRTAANIRQQLVFHDKHEGIMGLAPYWGGKHGGGTVSSWMDIDDKARAGFENESLVFIRPRIQFPLDINVPNIAFAFGDGKGGIAAQMSAMKGDWKKMWERAGLEGLSG